MNRIQKKLLHFTTDGSNPARDFAAARARKIRKLRQAANACFYIHLAAGVCCVIAAAVGLGICAAFGIIAAAVLAVCVVSFLALVRTPLAKAVVYIADLCCVVGCIAAGVITAKTAFFICGCFMLLAAAASLCGFFVGSFRQFLAGFDPGDLTPEYYTTVKKAAADERVVVLPKPEPAPPAPLPPVRSEMELLAEKLARILNPVAAVPVPELNAAGEPVPASAEQNGSAEKAEEAYDRV